MCLAFCNTTSPLLAVGEIEIDTKGHFYLCQTQDVSEAFMEQLHLRSPWVGSTPYVRLADRKSGSYKREALPRASWGADYAPPNPAFSQHPRQRGRAAHRRSSWRAKSCFFIISFNLIKRFHGIYFLCSKINSPRKASSPSEGAKM